ncbi:hypothetical protein KD3_23290 [Yersinia pseudotuberculosis]|nr:Uncharacterised protein [Yersinia pseudotuberculosis]
MNLRNEINYTATISTESREIFEVWANKQPSATLIGLLERKGETYRHPYHSILWECWKECCKNIAMELIPLRNYTDYMHAGCTCGRRDDGNRDAIITRLAEVSRQLDVATAERDAMREVINDNSK